MDPLSAEVWSGIKSFFVCPISAAALTNMLDVQGKSLKDKAEIAEEAVVVVI